MQLFNVLSEAIGPAPLGFGVANHAAFFNRAFSTGDAFKNGKSPLGVFVGTDINEMAVNARDGKGKAPFWILDTPKRLKYSANIQRFHRRNRATA